MEQRIFRIALTGGPCAGKTTLLNKLLRVANSIANVKIIIAMEAATEVKHSGISFVDAGGDSTFQELIIDQQLTAENRAFRVANTYAEEHPNEKVIIICDRGIMDGEAYFDSPAEFAKVLRKYSLNRKLVYSRYDAVICLRSAAIGAREFYTTMDGTPRDETLEQAATLDKKVCMAWREHDKYTEIDNSFNFYKKLDTATSEVFAVAGIEIPNEVCKRYIVEMPNLYELASRNNTLSLFTSQIFCLEEQSEANAFSYLKIHRAGGNTMYYLANQRWDNVNHPETGELVEAAVVDKGYSITEKKFINCLSKIDCSIKILEKMTYSFYLGAAVRCELDLYRCNPTHAYLRAYVDVDTKDNRELVERTFNIIREVTYNKAYSEHEIARTEGAVLNNK